MAVILEIVVVPSSGMQKWLIDKRMRLKCYLKSPAQKGKANNELIKFLANSLACRQSDIEIVSGFSHRLKKIKVHFNLSYQEIYKKLGVVMEKQHAIF